MQNPVPHCITRPLASLMLLAAFGTSAWAQTHPLNDTGITWSGHATSGNESGSNCGGADHPAGQDCQYGRDKAAVDGTLDKTGGSALNNGIANGFDYTKVCNNGALAGEDSCPNDPSLGADANEWACTKDNVTGLIWEVKVNDANHLRHMGHTYTWYNSAGPDGNAGYVGTTDTCTNTLDGVRCNTQSYVEAVNTVGLCGATDWRMPTVRELRSIADLGRANPAIDPTYFPNTPSSWFWSGSPFTRLQDSAWLVYFDSGHAQFNSSVNAFNVRLVRDGQ